MKDIKVIIFYFQFTHLTLLKHNCEVSPTDYFFNGISVTLRVKIQSKLKNYKCLINASANCR